MSILQVTKTLIRSLLLMALFVAVVLAGSQHPTQAQATTADLVEQKAQWWEANLLRMDFPAAPRRQPIDAATPAALHWRPWSGLVVQAWIENNWEVYLYGQGTSRLTNSPADDTRPRLNIGGTRVAFVSNRDGNEEIYVMNVDGTVQTRLTFDDAIDTTPYWSPDSRELAFVSNRTGVAHIFKMNANGTGLVQLTDGPEDDLYPSWSPDGHAIVWVRRVGRNGVLWVMNADGSGQHPISEPLRFAGHPVWSPDSTRIAFDADLDLDGFNHVFIVNADGSGLAPAAGEYPGASVDRWMGAWDLDGFILYTSALYWGVNDGHQWELTTARVEAICVAPSVACSPWTPNQAYQIHPDMQLLDILPPESHIEPLPLYSRQSGFKLRVSVQEQGPAGLHRWNIQLREAGDSEWQDYRTRFLDEDAVDRMVATGYEYITVAPLAASFFRSSAVDNAQNREPWNTRDDGDVGTYVFSTLLSGQLTDMRGVPRRREPVLIEPSAYEETLLTGGDGGFAAHLRSTDDHLLYGAARLSVQGDQERDAYLLPGDNLIQDGGFEAEKGLSPWRLRGAASITQSTALAHSGEGVATLGITCAVACFQPLPAGHVDELRHAALFSDPHGDLHIIGHRSPTLYHQVYSRLEGWLPYTVLTNQAPDVAADLDFGTDGTLHLVWAAQGYSNPYGYLYHTWRSPDGRWSTPQLAGQGGRPQVTVGDAGVVHLLTLCPYFSGCSENSELHYRTFTPGKGWSSPQVLVESSAIHTYQLLVRGDELHLVWAGYQPETNFQMVAYQQRTAQGKWSAYTVLDSGGVGLNSRPERYDHLALRSDAYGNLHVAWQIPYSGEVGYTTRSPDGFWSEPRFFGLFTFDTPYNLAQVALDQRGQLHLIGYDANAQRLYRRTKGPGNDWSVTLSEQYRHDRDHSLTRLHTTATGVQYATSTRLGQQTVEFLERTRAVTATVSHVEQTVTLPPDLHRPTLAFLHEVMGTSSDDPVFTVTVTDNMTATVVYSRATDTGWRLGWADLAPWLGETITVTFGLTQAAGAPYVQARVDQVSIGSWRTPVIEAVTPAQIPAGVSATLIITGDNFIETPTIRLGDTSLTDVRWLDDRRIEAVAPTTLDAGLYDLWVTNPDGSSVAEIGAVRVGEQVYLPMLFGVK